MCNVHRLKLGQTILLVWTGPFLTNQIQTNEREHLNHGIMLSEHRTFVSSTMKPINLIPTETYSTVPIRQLGVCTVNLLVIL